MFGNCISAAFFVSLSMKQNKLTLFEGMCFNDKRIAKRAQLLLSSMITQGTAVINKCCSNFTEKIGAYRMLNNERCKEEAINQALTDYCLKNIKTKHVLCLQDTTEINYENHSRRMRKKGKHAGVVSNHNVGHFAHPVLVIDPEKCQPLGFSSIKLWNREESAPSKKERKYKTETPDKKESYRWIEALDKSRGLIPGETTITIIGDRESDIYDLLTKTDEHTHILVRSNQNRSLSGGNVLLAEKMDSAQIRNTYGIQIPRSHGRKARTALMELRFEAITLKCPLNNKNPLKKIQLYCVYAKESDTTVPQGTEPIQWRLLTTHQIKTIEQAKECIHWYQCRWYIEELFRILKSKGFKIEEIQLEEEDALRKMLLLSLQAALQIMMLKIGFDKKDEDTPACLYFTQTQIKLLFILLPTLEGKTDKQKNPYKKESLAWAAWIIARLGSWGGYITQSIPGYITFKTGMDRFMERHQLFIILMK